MWIKTGLKRINRALLRQYAQILPVIAAFAFMVISSYLFVRNAEVVKLREDVVKAISYTELNIRSGLLEPEAFITSLSETVRLMLLDGYGIDKVSGYIQNIHNYVQSDPQRRIFDIVGIYGVFDVFGGDFIVVSDDMVFPKDYNPVSRPWYTEAVKNHGELYISQPFFDPVGLLVHLTFSRCIHDENGVILGVVCMGIRLDKIQQYAIETKFAQNGFGFLLNQDMELIAHPEVTMLGTGGLTRYEDELLKKGSISESVAVNYQGVKSIIYVQKLYNGWYMGIVTPEEEYYKNINDLAFILTVLGAIFAAILSVILINLASAKNKLAARNQAMAHWYKSILDAVNVPITVTNKNMEWTFVNTAVEQFLKVDRKDIMGKKCSEWNADICGTENCGITRLRNGYIDTYFEQFGGKYHVSVSYLYNENGEADGHVEVVKDLTEIIEVTKKQSEAEAANRAKSDFLARVSHEIRTPMNAILGITEIQLQNEKLPPDTQEALGRVYNSGYLLLNIINDILDLSKIEAGKLELVPSNYDVASMINDTVNLILMRYDSKPIEFKVRVDDNVPSTLFGDDLRIKQILNNLLSNAFKYTDKGEVELSVAVEESQIESQMTLVFQVSDTGQGMTKEDMAKLFDEYSRFNIDANRATEGTGLGMAITRHLVNMMDGNISVKSEPGKGSVFTVRLQQGFVDNGLLGKELTENLKRYRLGAPERVKKSQQFIREYMPYGRVLVVDDVETNLYVVRGLLAPYGLSVETAESGYNAIDKIRNGSTYDIIFMDHFMPDMDGMEATRIIRSLCYPHPIIALTANAVAGQAEVFLSSGFDGFISKPIDIRQLNTTLIKLIRDKYPADVVEAAQKLRAGLKDNSSTAESQPDFDPKLAEVFIRDAEKAIAVLDLINKYNFRRADDMNMFVINVHAMKSALANIGEAGLSDAALNLEKAGKDGNLAEIADNINLFLDSLKCLLERIRPQDNEGDAPVQADPEDMDFLREKLALIRDACSAFDKKTAKKALADINKKKWPGAIKDKLDDISEHLLHSEFEEAAKVVTDIICKF